MSISTVMDLEFKVFDNCPNNTMHRATVNVNEFITVLDRLTGFSGGVRDIETGFRDQYGKFWLASGGFDIRDFPEMTIPEAVQHIKDNANTCVGA